MKTLLYLIDGSGNFSKPKKSNSMNKPYRFVEKSKGESMEITQGKKEKVKNDKISQIIKFHECSDFSHTRAECSNF